MGHAGRVVDSERLEISLARQHPDAVLEHNLDERAVGVVAQVVQQDVDLTVAPSRFTIARQPSTKATERNNGLEVHSPRIAARRKRGNPHSTDCNLDLRTQV